MPTDQVKVVIAERNGGDLEDAEELDLEAGNVYLSSSSFPSADNVQLALESIVFGRNYQFAEQNAETSTTSTTTWANKLTLTTPSLPSGNYYWGFQFIWRAAAASREAEFRLQLNGSSLVEWEPSVSRTQENQLLSGFHETGTISGVNTLKLDFRVGGSGTTIYVREAHFVFWRIS